MAATNRPKRYTERVLLTLEPQDLSKLNELAEMDGTTRTEAAREAIRDRYARLQRRNARTQESEDR